MMSIIAMAASTRDLPAMDSVESAEHYFISSNDASPQTDVHISI